MHKLCGQLVVGLLLALEPGALIGDVGVLEAVGLGLLAVVSMNAINTWDHADGLTGGLSAVALATGAPGLAAAVAGYLPFNTFLRQPLAGAGPGVGARTTGAPRAMLGDSGSHLLGVALVLAGLWVFYRQFARLAPLGHRVLALIPERFSTRLQTMAHEIHTGLSFLVRGKSLLRVLGLTLLLWTLETLALLCMR